jgi:malonyl-CoA/methylmalonyl-CoA synthetase
MARNHNTGYPAGDPKWIEKADALSHPPATAPQQPAGSVDPYAWIEAAVARGAGERSFLVTASGLRLSYADLDREAGRWAAALLALGVTVGDRVVVQVDKSPQALLLYVACLRVGAVYVPVNTANTPAELEYFLRDAAPRVAVLRPADVPRLATLVEAAGVAQLETLGALNDGSLAARVAAAVESPGPRPGLGANALAAIIYTSGTTGRAKGAMLTRGNLASNSDALAAAWRFTAADVLLHALPLFHVHGLFAALNTVLASGASLVLLDGFDAAEVLRLLPRATVLMGVPTFYTRLLQLPALDRSTTATIRLFVSGSAPLLAETHREFERRTGHVILERYGMTETLMNTSNPYDGVRLPGFVGLPLPGIELRLVDPASDAPPADAAAIGAGDTIGAIEIRGPNVCAGYWLDPAKTQSEFRSDGWFRSGDLGRFNAQGYLQIVGRAKDLVISGGYNVYPKELEQEIDALPGVAESAVIGVPHPDFGEGVTAVVVARPGAALTDAGILAALQARLARYKLPKRVILVDQLPRNAMGKVQKNLLRQQYADLYQALP